MRLIVVSGLSGAGKSIAMHALEDLSFYCIDNLPAGLLPALARELKSASQPAYTRAAVAIDARNPAEALQELPEMIQALRQQELVHELVFLEAVDDTLIKRFSETRRKHPLTEGNVSLAEAIARERALLAPVRQDADICIDTSRTHLHELRELIRQRLDRRPINTLSILLQSFGYKHGLPSDADMVFDVRCLPNPHWKPYLRPLTGCDLEVQQFLDSESLAQEMLETLTAFLETWIPRFELENRAYMTVAIGCTGGRHRSVYLCERLASRLSTQRPNVLVRHREIA
jgi:UPF0042 nucleotide-binding protein